MRINMIKSLACMLILLQAQFAMAEESILATENTNIDDVISTPDAIELTGCQQDCVSCDGCDICPDSCDGCGHGCGLLGGLIKPTSQCFSDYISPMTNPTFFEDPRTLTEARFIYVHHNVPEDVGGGQINLFALHLRAALTDRLSIIATKDGFITSTHPLISDGWADLSVGLKYNLFADYQNESLLSAGLVYELPVGSTNAFQGNGDGIFHLFASGGMKFGEAHWVSGSGFILPADTSAESQWWYWSNHLDVPVSDTGFYLLTEWNWYHYLNSGNGGIPGVEGGDLFNFGSTGVAGNDIVTAALGMKWKPGNSNNMELGLAFEVPVTNRRDVLENRLTFDCIVRY